MTCSSLSILDGSVCLDDIVACIMQITYLGQVCFILFLKLQPCFFEHTVLHHLINLELQNIVNFQL